MSSTETMLRPRRKLLPAAIVAALVASSPLAAQAVVLAVSKSSYDVTLADGASGGSPDGTPVGAGPPPPDDTSSSDGSAGPPSPFAGSSDVLFFDTIGDGAPLGLPYDSVSPAGTVSVGIHTFGTDTGSLFGSRSSADVNGNDVEFLVDGDFQLDFDFTGSSFQFNIIPGQVYASANPTGGLLAGDFMQANLLLDIEASSDGGVNYTSYFASQAMARVDSTGSQVSWSGENLNYGCAMGPAPGTSATLADCSITGGLFTLDLVTVDNWDIRYTLRTETTGFISAGTGACGFGDGSGLEPLAVGGRNGDGGGQCAAAAQIGDPLAFAAAPAPATLGMAALGLLALRRSRRKQALENA